jgi:hypothetical protein
MRPPVLLLIEVALLLTGPLVSAAPPKVGQWDRFETIIPNATTYADPFRDVTLQVTYTKPDGQRVEFWGFYDGSRGWKIRFMPDQLGTWTYVARFSDGSPGLTGRFRCVRSTIPGLLTADESNPRWFGFKGGRHGQLRSFHAGPLFDTAWDDPNNPANGERRKAFLDWAAGQGYNLFSSSSYFAVRKNLPQGPQLWPIQPEQYRRVEWVLNELSDRRMMIHGFAGFFGQERAYPTDTAEQRVYLRYCVARIGPYWNQLWNVAGPEPNLTKHLTSADVNRLGTLIQQLDPFGHPLGVHNRDGDDPHRQDSWSSFVTLQDEFPDLNDLSQYLLRNHTGTKPVLAHETLWMGNTLQPPWTLDDLRRHHWVHLLSATTYNAGDMAGRSHTGFSGSLDLSDAKPERHAGPKLVWDFMETLPFYRMTPRPDLRDAGYLLAEEGRQYLAYLPAGGRVSIRVQPGKAYRVTWINARTPLADQRRGPATRDGANLTAPDGNDWLVYLTR